MAVYSVGEAMKHYRIRNNNEMALQKKILKKEDFVGVIIYYHDEFKIMDNMRIHTDRDSFDMETERCLEVDIPFKFKLVQDREIERERSIF